MSNFKMPIFRGGLFINNGGIFLESILKITLYVRSHEQIPDFILFNKLNLNEYQICGPFSLKEVHSLVREKYIYGKDGNK